MKKSFNRGFTLIELLVVIAIIGILASVILASLNSARAKGTDAAVKSDFSSARAQAELFYDNNNSYSTVCTTAVTSSGIKDMIADAAAKGNYTYTTGNGVASSATNVACHDSASAWAASAPLKSITGTTTYFCVDSTGVTKQDTIPLATSGTYQYACQ